jgi:ribosomal protein L16/L10AE
LKIWIFLKPNYPISKKSKNSRMGKGVGSFIRWVVKLNQGFIFIRTRNFNWKSLKKLQTLVKRNFGSHFTLNSSNNFY